MKEIGIAIVGLHNWYHAFPFGLATRHIPNVKLVAIAHDEPAHLKKCADDLGIKEYSTDMEGVIRRKDVDAVIFNAYTSAHLPLTKVACEENKDILCDKPLEVSLERAREMVQRVKKSGVKFMIAHGMRATPEFRKVKELLKTKVIGDIVHFHFSVNGILPKGWMGINDPGWYVDPEKAGYGGFMDLGIPQLDGLRYLFEKEAEKVTGTLGNLVYKNLKVEDYGLALVEFAEDIKGVVEASWTSVPPSGYNESVRLNGTRGNLTMDGGRITLNGKIVDDVRGRTELVLEPVSFELFTPIPGIMEYPIDEWYYLLEDFANSILDDKDPPQTVDDGLRTLELAIATFESHRQQRPIKISELRNTSWGS